MIARERLYLTDDRRRVVKENDPAAAFLLAAVGDEVPQRFARLIETPAANPPEAVPEKPRRKK